MTYEVTGLASVACTLLLVAAFAEGWPWWSKTLLGVGAIVFFFAFGDDE